MRSLAAAANIAAIRRISLRHDRSLLLAARLLERRTRTTYSPSPRRRLQMSGFIARLVRDEQGQDLIEYVLIGSFVSIGALAGATTLGLNLNTWYENVAAWVLGASNIP
jgi:Flp pilus assembly pilin Flp